MSNSLEITQLDPRGKWDKLRIFKPHQKRKTIRISTSDLKLLCQQSCKVAMYHFNVCTKISTAYDDDCKLRNQIRDEKQLSRLFRRRGLKIYKKFYEPRLDWFHQQRDFLLYLRQDEFYYNILIEKFKGSVNEKDVSMIEGFSRTHSGNIYVRDSFDQISENSQDFIKNLMALPLSYQSTQLAGSDSLEQINMIL